MPGTLTGSPAGTEVFARAPRAVPVPCEGPAPNGEVARCLEEVALLLQQQEASPFRVRAYRNAAATVRTLPVSVAVLYRDGGLEELERISGVGPAIGRAIRDIVLTGRLPLLQRLRGETDPVLVFAGLPGVGRRLAERLHHELGASTLEELELAAHDGRLAALPGFGARRVAAIIAGLERRLGRIRTGATPALPPPPVAELLEVDRAYREAADADRLPRIAPRRFNRGRRAWLPVLHEHRGPRHYTALYSNTALAHRLDRTRDWVVIFSDGGREEHQATVVTARSGPLAGRRVVRGRESECAALYHGRPP